MRRFLAGVLFVLTAYAGAYAAVTTTTITRTIYSPGGVKATAGTVTAILSTSGTTLDGAVMQPVAGRVSATISTLGAISLTVVPNDTITPTGTYYTVKFAVSTPVSTSWSEMWSVASSGVITRLQTPTGISLPDFTSLIRKNGYMVTVCATGCDYSTIQAALDGTTATAAQPVTILVMPGTYAECLTLETTDSYKTIEGPGADAATITCTSQTSSAVYYSATGGTDLTLFAIRDIRINQVSTIGVTASGAVYFMTGTSDSRFDLDIRNVHITSTAVAAGIVTTGLNGLLTTTKTPSSTYVRNSIIACNGNPLQFYGNASLYSKGNRLVSTYGVGGLEQKCYSDHGNSAGGWSGTEFIAEGDVCIVSGPSVSDLDSTCGVCLYTGARRTVIRGLTADISYEAGTTNIGRGILLGTRVANATGGFAEISDSTFNLHSLVTGQTVVGAETSSSTRLVLRNVRFQYDGPSGSTYTGAVVGSTTDTISYLLYDDGTNIDSVTLAGSGVFGNYNPTVVRKLLQSTDGFALPVTGAAADATGQYWDFDPDSATNASWQTLRVKDSFNGRGLYSPKFRLYWVPKTANSGSVVWKVGACSATTGTAWPCTVASFTTFTSTMTGAAGAMQVTAWTAFPASLFTAGYALNVQVQRLANDGTDDMTGLAELAAIEIAYEVY